MPTLSRESQQVARKRTNNAPRSYTAPAGDFSVILGIGILLVLFCAALAFGSVEEWSYGLLEFASAALLALWGILQAFRKRVIVLWSGILLPAFCFWAILGIQVLQQRTSYLYLTKVGFLQFTAFGILMFLTLQAATSDNAANLFLHAIPIFGGMVATFAILQMLSYNGRIYWILKPQYSDWVFGPYVNRNHYAGLMEMLVPFAIVIATWRKADQSVRLWMGGAAVIMAASIFLTQSRGGISAFAIELVFLIVVLRRRVGTRVVSFVGIGAALTLVLIYIAATHNVLSRFATVGSENRVQIVRDGLKMIHVHPYLGFGMGTFATVYPQYRGYVSHLVTNAAHNDYLQFLVETGWLGFAAGTAFVLLVFAIGLARIRKGGPHRNLRTAALAGCLAILVHSAVDFNMQIPANAAWFFVLAALAAVPAESTVTTADQRLTSKR